jgi:hypothetical protein
MLAQLLERRGLGARVLPADAIGPERIAGLDLGGVEFVCLSYLGPAAVAHARQACRRLRRQARGSLPVYGADSSTRPRTAIRRRV